MSREDIRLQEMLVTLRTRLLVMCAATSIALENTSQALANKDIGKATAVIEGDCVINALENEIDERALLILVRNQPVASDLRFVISSLRIATDLERICDEAVSIAEHATLMSDVDYSPFADEVIEFLRKAREVVEETITAFRNNDTEKAKELSQGDADALQEEVRLLQHIMGSLADEGFKLNSPLVFHLILVVHSITRIWRRSVNFAEQIYFYIEGINLKHADNVCHIN